jgi:hypothetical protein
MPPCRPPQQVRDGSEERGVWRVGCGVNISPWVLAELDKLEAALVPEPGLRFVEFRVDRRRHRELQTRLGESVAAALARSLGETARTGREFPGAACRKRVGMVSNGPVVQASTSSKSAWTSAFSRGNPAAFNDANDFMQNDDTGVHCVSNQPMPCSCPECGPQQLPDRRVQLTADACYCSGSASGSCCSTARRA